MIQQQAAAAAAINNHQCRDTTQTKIFVGGLSYHTTDETLRKYFERFGLIEEAVVITDRQTSKSKGYGFVTMCTKEAASQAVCDPNPVIDGRKANVNLAYLGAKPRHMPSSNMTVYADLASVAGGLVPLHINAYQAIANAYGLHPAAAAATTLCYPNNQLLQPNIFLSTTNPIANGSLLDLAAIQNGNSQPICQNQLNLLEAISAANRGLTMPQATAALYAAVAANQFNQPCNTAQVAATTSTATKSQSPFTNILNNQISSHLLQHFQQPNPYDRSI